MTNVLCVRCGEPIVVGQLTRMIQDESGRATYSHVMRVGDEFVPGCPQPEPVAESGEEEEPATEGPASPQVNMSAELPGATERTAGETLSTDRVARSVVGAPPFPDLNRILRDLANGLRGERGGAMMVPIADLRVIRAALDRAARVEATARNLDGAIAAYWLSERAPQDTWEAVDEAREKFRAALTDGRP